MVFIAYGLSGVGYWAHDIKGTAWRSGMRVSMKVRFGLFVKQTHKTIDYFSNNNSTE